MIKSGIYQLLIELSCERRIEVGNLGPIGFRTGLYIYTGSAKNTLPQRLGRHFRENKTKFWHIDYLLQYGEIVAYHLEPFRPGMECRLNKMSKEQYQGSEYIPAFGSSDCKCPSHLIYLPHYKNIKLRQVYN